MIARIAYVAILGAPAVVVVALVAGALAGTVVGLRASFALLNLLPVIGGLASPARRGAVVPAWLC